MTYKSINDVVLKYLWLLLVRILLSDLSFLPENCVSIFNRWKCLFHFSDEQPLQVARCTKIINADSDDPKYIINVKQFAKFVVDLSDQVAPTDIEEGMRVG